MTPSLLPTGSFLVAVVVAACAGGVKAPSPDADVIADLRAASNAALRAGDLDAFMASIDGDYVATAGAGGHARSRDELREIIAGVFRDTPGRSFVRTPESIEVEPQGTRAMERGRWIALEPPAGGGERRGVGGGYTAHWRRVDGRWVIHAEIFITLSGPGQN